MREIRAYTLDPSKLLKLGELGYNPDQPQAKTDVIFDGHVGQECTVEVLDTELKSQLIYRLGLAGYASHTGPLCFSVDVYDKGKAYLCAYYLHKLGAARHKAVSGYLAKESNYALAAEIISMLAKAKQ